MTLTHTFALLAVPPEVYDDIKGRLEAADRHDVVKHTVLNDQEFIDMDGLALARAETLESAVVADLRRRLSEIKRLIEEPLTGNFRNEIFVLAGGDIKTVPNDG